MSRSPSMSEQTVRETETETEPQPGTEATPERPRRRRRLVAGVAAALVAASAATYLWTQRDALDGDAAFAVGGDQVRVAAVEQQSRLLTALYGIQRPTGGDELARYWRDLAKSMAVARVLDAAADDLGVEVTRREGEQALAQYVTGFYGQGEQGRRAFVDALASQGSSEPAVLAEIERQLLVTRLFEKVTAGVPAPTADEVEAAFRERRCSLVVPAQRRLANIVTGSRGQAETAARRLREGATFAATARALSQDASTARTGGDLGWVDAGRLEKSYAAAAFGARPGAVFGPVRTRYGWNVGLVRDTEPAHRLTLAQVSGRLSQVLRQESAATTWRDWLTRRLARADVHYADRYRPADPTALPDAVQPGAATTSNGASGAAGCGQAR